MQGTTTKNIRSIIFRVTDTILINIGFIIAYIIKFDQAFSLDEPIYNDVFIVFNLAWFVLMLVYKIPYTSSRISRSLIRTFLQGITIALRACLKP